MPTYARILVSIRSRQSLTTLRLSLHYQRYRILPWKRHSHNRHRYSNATPSYTIHLYPAAAQRTKAGPSGHLPCRIFVCLLPFEDLCTTFTNTVILQSVTIISVIRLNYLLKLNLNDPDVTWNFVDVGLWSVLEANIAMICGTYSSVCTLKYGC